MNLIALVDQNFAIGCQGHLLVHSPVDLAYFKEKTLGKVIIMGRKTVGTLPNQKPLAGRTNIVLTTQGDLSEGFLPCQNLGELFDFLANYPVQETFVIGGEAIYQLLLPYCTTAYLTKIQGAFPADRYLPNFDHMADWQLKTATPFTDGLLEGQFCQYTRKESLL